MASRASIAELFDRRLHGQERREVANAFQDLTLSFYGDGPRWDNALLIPAFPTGYSFQRPLRYRESWIQKSVLDVIKSNPAGFQRLEVNLGMRFKDNELGFIPFRRATITHVSSEPGDRYFEFKMGDFFPIPQDTLELRALVVDIPPSVAGELCFTGVALGDRLKATSEPPGAVWSRLVDLIAKTSMPVDSAVSEGIFLHVCTPRKKRPLAAKSVNRSWSNGFRYGLKLREGSAMEFSVLHRIPKNIGTNNPPAAIDLNIDSSTESIVLTPRRLPVTSNYDRHIVSGSAGSTDGNWATIEIGPSPEMDMEAKGLKLPRLSLSGATVFGFWHRLRTVVVPLLLLSAAFVINALVSNYEAFKDDRLKFAVVVAASAVASLLILVNKR